MARKDFPEDEPWSSPRGATAPAEIDVEAGGSLEPIDARVVDLQPEQDSPFLRTQKRVPVRRGPLPKKTAVKLKYVLIGVASVTVVAAIFGFISQYGHSSWRFRLESSDSIQVEGNHNISRWQVINIFGPDISRNIFAIPLAERKAQLERISWVESAVVMRLLPNRLGIKITERTPIAFAQVGSRIMLVDPNGVLMQMPRSAEAASAPARKYSFPVVTGLGEAEPLAKRAARMRVYQNLMREMDAGGANYSRDIDQVDLADPEDVKITVANPQGAVLIHLGPSNFLDRYKIFVAHVQEWRQQFQKLDSVDLRYDRQVIVNPDAPRVVSANSVQNTQPDGKSSHSPVKPVAAVAKRSAAKRHRKAQATLHDKTNAVKLETKSPASAHKDGSEEAPAQAKPETKSAPRLRKEGTTKPSALVRKDGTAAATDPN
jgi:cell division protein FtsQ